MAEKKTFVLINDRVRGNAMEALRTAADHFVVTISEPKRSNDQNAKYHAICADLAKSGMKWAGKCRTLEEWKVLLISGHAVATNTGGEVIPGVEGEFVAIRESSANMRVARASSLIEYSIAFCTTNGVKLTETTKHGFIEERFQ